ncbi:unnamed protein product [Auanema sp. JU1783]|nr:unnamed protein product [Auanema sp. JU1783]
MSASSVSLNTDVNVRYEKLATEYGKLRAQAKVLREGVLDERAKNEKAKEELKNRDSVIRKLQSENESLIFRNEQLSKRVEALQTEVEQSKVQSSRSSKKVKDNPSKDVLEQLQSMTKKVVVLEEELANKLAQNETLSRKLVEMENVHIEEISEQSEKFRVEITKLDKALQDALADNTKTSKRRPVEPVRPLYIHAEPRKNSPDPIDQLAPKSTMDGSIFEDVSDVYLQGLESSKQILQNLSNLFHLLSQRSTLYPFDSSMEQLPRNINELSVELSSKCTLISNSVDVIDEIINRGSIDWTSDTKLLHASLASFVSSCSESLTKHLHELSREESKTLYADKKIEELNSQWCDALLELIRTISELTYVLKDLDMEVICEKMISFTESVQNVERIFSDRWKIESRFPAASKKLHCICDAIMDCMKKLSIEANKISSKLNSIVHSVAEPPANSCEETPDQPEEPQSVVEEVISVEISPKFEFSETTECLVSPPIRDSSKEDILIINTLKERVAELELEREKHLVDLSLLKRKVANLQSTGNEHIENVENMSDADHVREFGKSRLIHLMDQRQQAESKAMHYHKECAILIRKIKSLRETNVKLESDIIEMNKCREKLEDELCSVRHGYDTQLSSLSEHIAELNAKEKSKTQNVQNSTTITTRGLKSLFK